MGFLTQPLAPSLMSSGFSSPAGHPGETFDFPSTVVTDDSTIPDYENGMGPEAYRGNTGDLFQESHNAAEGVYHLDYLNAPGPLPGARRNSPAPGSADLIEPREAHGIPGTNRAIHSQGPVTGTPDNAVTFQRTRTQAAPVGLSGPVIGGADTGHGTSQAYWAAQNALYSQAAAEAGLMAAI